MLEGDEGGEVLLFLAPSEAGPGDVDERVLERMLLVDHHLSQVALFVIERH